MINGKRFTKTEMQAHSFDDLAGVSFPPIMKKIEDARQVAENVLSDRGLPTDPKISWTGIDGREWHGFLDRYVAEYYLRDSPEWFAAKIIVIHNRLQSATGDHAVELAYKLGQLTAFARVYGIESHTNTRNAENKPDKPPWGEYGAMLREQHPHKSANEIWRKIPTWEKLLDDPNGPGDFYFYRETDANGKKQLKVYGIGEDKDRRRPITFEYFRTQFLPPKIS